MVATGLMEFAGSLATAAKLLKSLKDLVSAPDAKAQVSELYDVIISSQASALQMLANERSMLEEIGELKAQLSRVQAWETEKQRYRLATPISGVTCYALQKSMSNGEPPHYICGNCYQNGKRSMLAYSTSANGFIAIVCAACKFSSQTRYRCLSPAKYAEDIAGPE